MLAEDADLDYLVLECLAERTIALAQLRKRRDPAGGYDPLMKRRVEMLLPIIKRNGVKLISNFGAANPLAAADAILAIARQHGIPIKVAVVTGDDVLDLISPDRIALETGGPLSEFGELVSANAYLGAEALLHSPVTLTR